MKDQLSSKLSSLTNKLNKCPVIQSTPAVIIELMETLKDKAVYLSSKRRRRKLNNKINTPWYKKMSNTLL
jgi:hypothetical protein